MAVKFVWLPTSGNSFDGPVAVNPERVLAVVDDGKIGCRIIGDGADFKIAAPFKSVIALLQDVIPDAGEGG